MKSKHKTTTMKMIDKGMQFQPITATHYRKNIPTHNSKDIFNCYLWRNRETKGIYKKYAYMYIW